MIRLFGNNEQRVEEISNYLNFKKGYNSKKLQYSDLSKSEFNELKKYGKVKPNVTYNEFQEQVDQTDVVLAMNGENSVVDFEESKTKNLMSFTHNYKFFSSINLKNISEGLLFFFIYFIVISFIVGIIASIMLIISEQGDLNTRQYTNADFIAIIYTVIPFFYIILSVIMFAIYQKRLINQLTSFRISKYFVKIPTYFVIQIIFLFIMAYVIEGISSLSGQEIGVSENEQSLEAIQDMIPIGIYLFYVCVAAPIIEELIFRFILFDKLLGWTKSVVLKMIIGTSIFVFIHTSTEIYDLVSNYSYEELISTIIILLQYATLSAILSYVYIKERNIYLCIALHALNNILASVSLFM